MHYGVETRRAFAPSMLGSDDPTRTSPQCVVDDAVNWIMRGKREELSVRATDTGAKRKRTTKTLSTEKWQHAKAAKKDKRPNWDVPAPQLLLDELKGMARGYTQKVRAYLHDGLPSASVGKRTWSGVQLLLWGHAPLFLECMRDQLIVPDEWIDECVPALQAALLVRAQHGGGDKLHIALAMCRVVRRAERAWIDAALHTLWDALAHIRAELGSVWMDGRLARALTGDFLASRRSFTLPSAAEEQDMRKGDGVGWPWLPPATIINQINAHPNKYTVVCTAAWRIRCFAQLQSVYEHCFTLGPDNTPDRRPTTLLRSVPYWHMNMPSGGRSWMGRVALSIRRCGDALSPLTLVAERLGMWSDVQWARNSSSDVAPATSSHLQEVYPNPELTPCRGWTRDSNQISLALCLDSRFGPPPKNEIVVAPAQPQTNVEKLCNTLVFGEGVRLDRRPTAISNVTTNAAIVQLMRSAARVYAKAERLAKKNAQVVETLRGGVTHRRTRCSLSSLQGAMKQMATTRST